MHKLSLILLLFLSGIFFGCRPSLQHETKTLQVFSKQLEHAYGSYEKEYDSLARIYIDKSCMAVDEINILQAHLLYGRLLIRDKRFQEAYIQLSTALQFDFVDQHPALYAGLLVNIAYLYGETSNQTEKESILLRVIDMTGADIYYRAWAYASLDLCQNRSKQGLTDYFDKAYQLLPFIKEADQQIKVISRLAEILARNGQFIRAIELLEKEDDNQLSPLRQAYFSNQLGFLYLNAAQYVNAQRSLKKAYVLAESLESQELRLWTNCNLYKLSIAKADTLMAISHLEKAIEVGEAYEQIDEAVTFAFQNLQRLYQLSDNSGKANQVKDRWSLLTQHIASTTITLNENLSATQIALLKAQSLNQQVEKQHKWAMTMMLCYTIIPALVICIFLFVRLRKAKKEMSFQELQYRNNMQMALKILNTGKAP